MDGSELDAGLLTLGSQLASHDVLVDGNDLDEARSAVSRIFVDHRLIANAEKPPRPVTVSCRHFSALSLCYFDYGREIGINPDQLRKYYLLQLPLSGHVNVQSASRHAMSTVGSATLLPAERDFSMHWSEDSRQLVVRIDRLELLQCLERYLGQNLTKSPDFDLELDWSSERMAPLRYALGSLSALARFPAGSPGHAMIARAAEDSFMYGLLMLQASDMTKAIIAGQLSSACPRIVKRAEDYIEANLAEPITISDLVDASGGTARTLFDSFKRFRDMPPMRYVRHRRLLRAREDLKAGGPATGVADVAVAWGFQHLGRFAADYARQFGETPSETLKRARARSN
ncbi:MAG: AraC family transcriptional regulator [Rhizobiaceae bacterium]|nr:AraC family transcriptional regulator [Rhizobiaceae bacterium]